MSKILYTSVNIHRCGGVKVVYFPPHILETNFWSGVALIFDVLKKMTIGANKGTKKILKNTAKNLNGKKHQD